MPLQRRLPKRGFKSRRSKYNAEVTLGDLRAPGRGRSRHADPEAGQADRRDDQERQGHQERRADDQGRAQAAASSRPRAPRRRSKRPAARSPDREQPKPRNATTWQRTRISWPRAASSATCAGACSSCWARSSSTASGAHIPVPGIDPNAAAAAVPGPAGRHPEPVQHVLGRRAVALHRVRARDHAVHLGVDHHAADDLRRADARGAEEGRRVGRGARSRSTRATARSALALFQSLGIALALEGSPGLVIDPGFGFRLTAVVSLVAGTMFLMWLGEQITERGLGNGISILIFARHRRRPAGALGQFGAGHAGRDVDRRGALHHRCSWSR